jgi:ribosomal protein S18 acetylase RimI-like enzyme
MANEIEVHLCRVEDIDKTLKQLWLALALEMFEVEHYTMPSEANADRWANFVRESLTGGKSFLLVAKSEGKVVGFAYATIFRDYPLDVAELIGAINDVYVLPEFRGKSIGKKLMIECMNKMQAEDVKAVRLIVLSENGSAVKLYQRLGFRIFRYGMIKPLKH